MSRLQQLAINKEGFVFDPATGDSYSVNSVGLTILELLVAGMTAEEIAGEIAARYDVTREEVARDVDDFIDHLRVYRLV